MTTREASNVTALENTHKGMGGLDHGKNAVFGRKKAPYSDERLGGDAVRHPGLWPAAPSDAGPGGAGPDPEQLGANPVRPGVFRLRGGESPRIAEIDSHLG